MYPRYEGRIQPPDGKPDVRVCWSCDQEFDFDPDDVSGGELIDDKPTCWRCAAEINKEGENGR